MYDIFYIGNHDLKERFPTAKRVESFEQAQEQSLTKLFWLIWPGLNVIDDFDFSYKVDDYSLNVTHVFRNGENYDGVCLFPKHIKLHSREIDYRFFASKKEVNVLASTPSRYDIITVKDYEDYIQKIAKTKSEFVYVIPEDVTVRYNFEYTVPYKEKDLIHIFKNGLFNDGVFVQHRDKSISKREFEFCWYTGKKELDIAVSIPKPYDIVFISYNEPNADANYKALQQRFPRVKRVHGVKGIHNAHKTAAELCDTDMFWIVDGDAQIIEDFNFNYQVPKWQRDQVFVWHSRNPINDLEYGYGGVKLFPRKETLAMDTNSTDMSTSISSKFNVVDQVSNITAFNTGEFETWKSAFRECAKLSSGIINRQESDETEQRLQTWCTVGNDREFGEWAISGACAGREFGYANRDNKSALVLINDFDWLENKFKEA